MKVFEDLFIIITKGGCMRKFFITLILLLFSIYFFSSCVSIVGTNLGVLKDVVYVSASGDDSNPGTLSKPVLTLNKAIEIAKSNSIKKIYMEKGSWVYNNSTLSIPSDIEIQGGFDSSFVVQDGYSTLSGITLVMDNVSSVKLSKIAVKDSTDRGLKIVNGSDNIFITDCKFYNNSSSGDGGSIVIWNSGSITISSSVIYNSKSYGYGGGIDIYKSSYVYIQNNVITNCIADYDVDGEGGGGGISISSSTNVSILDSTIYDCGIPSSSGANDSVINLYGNYNIPGLKIKNNAIKGVSSSYSYGIYEETLVDVTGHEIIGNTFYSSKLSYPYYDFSNGSLSISQLNNGYAGTSVATNNVWY